MTLYKGFAGMYDDLMAGAHYEKWCAYINAMLEERFNNGRKPLIVDLACGTGNMTLPLSKLGYEMIGIDISTDMLAIAQQKSYEAGCNILFLAQDMRQLDLYGTVDAVICVCDGMNYILELDELAGVFERVKLFLNPGGIFMFDMNTEYKFKEVLGNRSFEATVPNGASYVWDNNYDEARKINEYHVLFYTNEKGTEAGHFKEMHKQRAYCIDEILTMLKNAGFSKVSVTHEYTNEPPRLDSERVTFQGI